MHEHVILATDAFFSSPIGSAVGALMKAIAVVVVLIAAVKAIRHVLDGKAAKAAGLVIGACILVAFLWDPSLIDSLISFFSGLVGKGTNSVDQITNNTAGRS